MVNFGLNSASILGIFLAVAGAGLYFLRSVRPEVSRDYDIFFSAVGLLCGLILLFQGWRLDPILQFGQLLLSGSTVFFAAETIRLRGITTEQARRSAPYAGDRRVSKTRVYTEAELDQLEPEDEPVARNNRRLRGYDDDARSGRPDGYGEAEARPRPRSQGRNAPPLTPTPDQPVPVPPLAAVPPKDPAPPLVTMITTVTKTIIPVGRVAPMMCGMIPPLAVAPPPSSSPGSRQRSCPFPSSQQPSPPS
ncbi:Ycf66 family protein [Synechocystis sp. B12]|nr:Ycf66 family protein [Synechocystis sp. B12]